MVSGLLERFHRKRASHSQKKGCSFMEWLLVVLAVGVFMGLGLVLWTLANGNRKMRDSGSIRGSGGGFSVWCYERGSWRCLENKTIAGFIPGPSPTGPGLYDGYCVK